MPHPYKPSTHWITGAFALVLLLLSACVPPAAVAPAPPGPSVLSLSWSGLTLQPPFRSEVRNYTIEVPEGETLSHLEVELTPKTVLVSGGQDLSLASDQPAEEVFRTLIFEGANGARISYTFQLAYPALPPGSTQLTALQFDAGQLEPPFSPSITSYILRVSALTTGEIHAAAAAEDGVMLTYLPQQSADYGGVWTFVAEDPDQQLPATTYSVQILRNELPPPPVLGNQRPYLSLAAWDDAVSTGDNYLRFRDFVNAAEQAGDGELPYGFSPMDALVLWHASLKDNSVDAALRQRYRDLALRLLRAEVNEAYAEMELYNPAVPKDDPSAHAPLISGDSYLEVGEMLTPLAYAYDAFYDELSPTERTQWEDYANQVLFNVWHPEQAGWKKPSNGVFQGASWSGWGTEQPGNNYHFSFLKGTMAWGLASRNQQWLDLLNQDKIPKLINYFDRFPGGGSREGTGYGVAQSRLFDLYQLWKQNTGQNLALGSSHALATLPYWIHATVPTMDHYAAIGDLSRDSYPTLFDTHKTLISQLVSLFPESNEAAAGRWWLKQAQLQYQVQPYNLRALLINLPGTEAAPSATVYHSPGAGHLFARSGWNEGAVWLGYVAGRLDESHAHQDQGSFQLYRDQGTSDPADNWLTVTANIWGRGGLSQSVGYHNGLRFEKDGQVLSQSWATEEYPGVASNLNWTRDAQQNLVVDSDLANAYSGDGSRTQVRQWNRRLTLTPHRLTVADQFDVAEGIRAVFQVQVPVAPHFNPDGSIQAGALTIRPLNSVVVQFKRLPEDLVTNEYYGDPNRWVVELHDGPRNGTQGSFQVELDY